MQLRQEFGPSLVRRNFKGLELNVQAGIADSYDTFNGSLVFGTGWGLADNLIPEAERALLPIRARGSWNHLSVRSAVAILLDRLFGLSASGTT